jgi:hypothetical protein
MFMTDMFQLQSYKKEMEAPPTSVRKVMQGMEALPVSGHGNGGKLCVFACVKCNKTTGCCVIM